MKLRTDTTTPRLIDPLAVGDALANACDRHAVISVMVHPDDVPLMGPRFGSRLVDV